MEKAITIAFQYGCAIPMALIVVILADWALESWRAGRLCRAKAELCEECKRIMESDHGN